jgi:hypothetical protein
MQNDVLLPDREYFNYKDWKVSAAFTLLDKKQFDDKFIKQTINYERIR